ncbi:MAG: NCS2 family permease [Phycisphaerales bacterium]|nr:NCS2 family permease [Phycisphaerales bacterium]
MTSAPTGRYPWWTRGDLDGFFGLMVDNLVQVLLIVTLCTTVAGIPAEFVFTHMLPGVAVSLIVGNLYYGLQARWVARRQNNPTCTALPYGINTPSVIAYALFIMGPVYRQTGDWTLAWQAGLLACLVSGVIETTGALYAERLRRITPRAALLGVLAAVGITFIAADFAFRMYASPLVGVLPLVFLLLAYFSRYRFPLGLPGGFLAIVFGMLIAWGTTLVGWQGFGGVAMSAAAIGEALGQVRFIVPSFCGGEILAALQRHDLLVSFLTVSIPMGVINVIGSLQNIESAEAGGDRFATAPSLAVNGLGTLAAGLFGSCFPTTIYIGHPGWKALGARASYSIVNGVFFTFVFLFGLGPFIVALIPIEAGAAIVMYIGIIITAQAFQATPRAHAPAVAIALFPALAALLVVKMGGALDTAALTAPATPTLATLAAGADPFGLYLGGLLTLTGANSSWIVVTLILAALGAELIDRRYRAATAWCAAAALLTALGLVHAYRLDGSTLHALFIWQAEKQTEAAVAPVAYRALPIAVGYGLGAVLLAAVAWGAMRRGGEGVATSDAEPTEAGGGESRGAEQS